MTERVCENCRWWENDQHAIGVCFRHVPMGNLGAPKTHATDRCGEWSDASITQEQEERQRLMEKFALAIVTSSLHSVPDVWAAAAELASANPRFQKENEQ